MLTIIIVQKTALYTTNMMQSTASAHAANTRESQKSKQASNTEAIAK